MAEAAAPTSRIVGTDGVAASAAALRKRADPTGPTDGKSSAAVATPTAPTVALPTSVVGLTVDLL
jgi:hypothetical protein